VDHSHWLVADGEAGLDGIYAFDNVQVSAADGGESDADDGFARTRLGDGNFLDANLVRPTEDEGFHCFGFAEAMVELYFVRGDGHQQLLLVDLPLCTTRREIGL
jgi:hypothetical protein